MIKFSMDVLHSLTPEQIFDILVDIATSEPAGATSVDISEEEAVMDSISTATMQLLDNVTEAATNYASTLQQLRNVYTGS